MKVIAERVGDRIEVRSPRPLRSLKFDVPGAYFSGRKQLWTVRLSMDSCRALRHHFGDQLVIFPELWKWAKEEQRVERSQAALTKLGVAPALLRIPEVYPGIADRMRSRSYQAAAARFVAEGRSVLIADTPGLGKTLEAIAGIIEAAAEDAAGPYLIVAPQTSLDTVWQREIETRVPDAHVVVAGLGGMNRTKRQAALAAALDPAWDLSNTWVIINIEMIRTRVWWDCPKCGARYRASSQPKSNIVLCSDEDGAPHEPSKVRTVIDHEYPELFAGAWGGIVMDECQRSLIRSSGTPTQTRAGAGLLRTHPHGIRIALSGTPMRGKPQRLWGTLNWLQPKTHTSFWSWVANYFTVTQEGMMGSRTVGNLRPERADDLSKSLDRMMIRRTKAEVSPELPAKQYMGYPLDGTSDPTDPVAVWLPMTSAQAKCYAQMAAAGSADVADGKQVHTIGTLAELTRLRQFACAYGGMHTEQRMRDGELEEVPVFHPELPSNKFDWLVQFLTERNIIDPDEAPTGKVIIVSQFNQTLDLFASELKTRYGVDSLAINGTITGKRRTEAQDQFNNVNSKPYLLFLNTQAGGVSITLDAADDMVFLDETWVPDDQEQAEDRINNRRPEERVATRRYWYLKSLGTVEEGIARANAEADDSQKQLLDGRRGVKYLKRVMEITKGL